VLLAGALRTVFTHITAEQSKNNSDGSTVVVNNYCGPVTVNRYGPKASGTRHKVSAKQARHSKGRSAVGNHCVAEASAEPDQTCKQVPGEQYNTCLSSRSHVKIASHTQRSNQEFGRMLSGCCIRSTNARGLARLVLFPLLL